MCVCVCVCRVVCVFGGRRFDNIAELTRVGGEMVHPEKSPDYIATTSSSRLLSSQELQRRRAKSHAKVGVGALIGTIAVGGLHAVPCFPGPGGRKFCASGANHVLVRIMKRQAHGGR